MESEFGIHLGLLLTNFLHEGLESQASPFGKYQLNFKKPKFSLTNCGIFASVAEFEDRTSSYIILYA